jgi:hypothetical protein
LTFEELVARWCLLRDDPIEIAEFCMTIPPEFEASFILWLLDMRSYLTHTIASRGGDNLNVN